MKYLLMQVMALGLTLSVHAQKAAVFTVEGKAIKGYDPVSFFTDGLAQKGLDSLHCEWNHAIWLFATAENRDSFKKAPEKYAPQYGGYCAYGAADGHKAPTETDTWSIVDGKLYFNYNKKVRQYWEKDRGNLIKKADANWPAIKDRE